MRGRTVSVSEYGALAGTEIGVSRWFALDQARISAFADVTEDRQFIHVDPVAAASTPFGGTIAHGFLTLSLFSAMADDVLPTVEGTVMGVNYGFNSIRFLNPVPVDRRVRGRFLLKDIAERSGDRLLSTLGVTVEIENEDRPAAVAEWLTLLVTAGG